MVYRNQPVKMGLYTVTYTGDSLSGPHHYYNLDYKRYDASGKIADEFVVKPDVLTNPLPGAEPSPSPDTKHFLFHDLYTHITAFLPVAKERIAGDGQEQAAHGEENDDKNYDAPVTHEVAVGDTMRFREGYIVLKSLAKEVNVQNIPLEKNDIAIGAKLEIVSHDKTYTAEPVYMIKNKNVFDFARKVDDAGLKLRLSKIIPDQNKVEIVVYQQPENKKPWIVIRALDFPFINLLWAGTVIMIIGFLLSIFRRNKELKTV